MRQKIYFVTILGNLIGALLTFVYSTYINVDLNVSQGAVSSLSGVLPFVIGTGFIFFVIITINHRWSRPLYYDPQGKILKDRSNVAYPEKLKRKVLQMAPMLAGTTLLAWIMAGFIFGMLEPVILHTFFGVAPITLTESLMTIFGVTIIGGFSTSLFIYFATESIWRKQIPLFFPEGDLSEVKGVFKLSVKARLLVVFLMISLIPLTLLGVSAYCKALALQTAGPAMGGQIISGLLLQILFITAIGVVLSVTLSLVVSKSVSAPLEEMVLAGIIGSKERSSYALVGDTVNLASRIQGLTKEFGCDIILSQTTHDLVAGSYKMEPLRAVKVKGKSEETMVYKLSGHNGSG